MSKKVFVPFEIRRWLLQRIFLELLTGRVTYHKASGMRWKVQTLIEVKGELNAKLSI